MSHSGPILRKGRVYFHCTYRLRDLPVPEIETWVYAGTNLNGETDAEYHYFERPELHYAKEMATEAPGHLASESKIEREQPRMRLDESSVESLIYDLGGLEEWLRNLRKEPNAENAF
ncbi:MAG: hypothetical protein DHS20C11_06190 [Lysobacteraceae bacterium]|nr:MAG: hypothetical protein DHS20C11_06190 [Xanthomonadaceae bacterium]